MPVVHPACTKSNTLKFCNFACGRYTHGLYKHFLSVLGDTLIALLQYLEIDPLQSTVAPKGNALLYGKHKWRGGALCLFGRVHCIPAEANCVLRIDPKSGEWATFGDLSAAGDGSKWNGGCFSDYDDRIYGVNNLHNTGEVSTRMI